jgi:hypothetical protein
MGLITECRIERELQILKVFHLSFIHPKALGMIPHVTVVAPARGKINNFKN